MLKIASVKYQCQCVCKTHHWSSSQIRKTFVDYFVDRNHKFVPSSSVHPRKNDGSYFVNSGMNQFKPLFLGTVDKSSEMASYKRVTNYQKCIRVGGKHNDLDEVGQDHYHHTFFEMLGNWSFNDYGKEEACKMAWELLTKVYKIPQERLFVTYFKGDDTLNLMPDTNCRDIWRSIGVPEQRILPFGMKENFWVMGDAGPCGPCTEIHYCHHQGGGWEWGRDLVNAGDERVVEIWNLVFMEFDRSPDGTLKHLPQKHIDTGMGLERLTALLNGTNSNYETDLFAGLFSRIHQGCQVTPYGGGEGGAGGSSFLDPVDRAYRVVADHARMFTVSIGDGLLPGRRESEAKLRRVMYRALYQANEVLGAPRNFLSTLVPVVIESLGEAYPNLQDQQSKVMEIVQETEQRYLDSIEVGRKMLKKALREFGDVKVLSGDQILRIQEAKFGKGVPYEIISLLAPEFNISLDEQDYKLRMELYKENISQSSATIVKDHQQSLKKFSLDQHDVNHLASTGVPTTVDHSHEVLSYDEERKIYTFPKIMTKVVALRDEGGRFVSELQRGTVDCGVVLEETPFYAEGGGQAADVGLLGTGKSDGGVFGKVVEVQECGGYIMHGVEKLENDVKVGDIVSASIDAERRSGCMANHSATHVIRRALHQVLGHVRQQGSSLDDRVLTFDFTCLKSRVAKEDLKEIVKVVNEFVRGDFKVNQFTVPLAEINKAKHLVMLEEEVYPNEVMVVSIGNKQRDQKDLKFYEVDEEEEISLELCGGTHVTSTGHIQEIVITNLEGSIQGTKRITAVTRDLAKQALNNYRNIKARVDAVGELENIQKILTEMKQIEKLVYSVIMPKLEREEIMERMKEINFNCSQDKNSLLIMDISKLIEGEIFKKGATSKDAPLVLKVPFQKYRDVIASLQQSNMQRPLLLLLKPSDGNQAGISYTPEGFTNFQAKDWADFVCSRLGGQNFPPKGKFSKLNIVRPFIIPVGKDPEQEVSVILKTAEEFLSSIEEATSSRL